MIGYSPKKELIFFIPGKIGTVFTFPAKQPITIEMLLKTQESLVRENNNPVVYIEERRMKSRV